MSDEPTSAPAIDKSTWGEGPWTSEPDRVDWIHAGYACMAIRHPHFGSWCAYVGVDEAHPLYGKNWKVNDRVRALEAHQGVNYSAACSEANGICHVPAPGMPEQVWWFGFDCHHSFDLAPAMAARERARGLRTAYEDALFRETYRTLEYVKEEANKLAEQLRALAPNT